MHTDEGPLKQVIPFNCINGETRRTLTQHSTRWNPQLLIPAHISEDLNSFWSRTFLIRYCDEEIQMNDIAMFEVDIDLQAIHQNFPIIIEAELMFADMTGQDDAVHYSEYDSLIEFRSVSVREFRLNYPARGVHEYIALIFDENHSCLTNIMLHSVLKEFNFVNHTDRLATSEISAYFFPSPKQTEAKKYVGTLETEKVYDKFVEPLQSSLDSLRKRYLIFLVLSPVQEGFQIQIPDESVSFSDRVKSHDADHVTEMLVLEMYQYQQEILVVLHKMYELVRAIPRQVLETMINDHSDGMRRAFTECCIRNWYKVPYYYPQIDAKLLAKHEQICAEARTTPYYQNLDPFSIEDLSLFPSPDVHPIIIEDVYLRDPDVAANTIVPADESDLPFSRPYSKGVHVIVLVHGFQGNAFDMRILKNNISQIFPHCLFMSSVSNQEASEGDIREMGTRLSAEVSQYIQDWCPGTLLGRLSFIGHSLGGLIIRAALPYLASYQQKMHLYMSLSSPHLGYMGGNSSLIDMGLWFLKKWNQSKCLAQLTMTDSDFMRETTLYELSRTPGLEYFKSIVLIGSNQDSYVPFDSARLEVATSVLEQKYGEIIVEMSENIIGRIKAPAIYKVDVNFMINESNLDTFIGRAAHIMFLENQALMKLLIYRYWDLFN